jgi:small subunit ribosomal protein S16
VAVKIRLKMMGRKHRPYFRICATDVRSPRDGKVLEELGTYDPMIAEADARVTLNAERVSYWLGVGAQPTEKAGVLIKKYSAGGTHVAEAEAARARLKTARTHTAPPPPPPAPPKPAKKKAAAVESEAPAAPAAEEKATEEKSE